VRGGADSRAAAVLDRDGNPRRHARHADSARADGQLVERLAAVARSLEREPATVGEVEERLALPRREEIR